MGFVSEKVGVGKLMAGHNDVVYKRAVSLAPCNELCLTIVF